jgi:hypothetical protein
MMMYSSVRFELAGPGPSETSTSEVSGDDEGDDMAAAKNLIRF